MGSGDPGIPHCQDLSEPIPGLAPRRLGGHIMYRRDQGAGEMPDGRRPRYRDTRVLSAGDANRGLTRLFAVDPIRHLAGVPTWHYARNLIWRPEVRAA